MRKNVASQVVGGQLVSKADGSAVTSGTTTVYVTGDNGSQGAGAGTVTHKGNGYWSYAPTQGETNYDHIAFTFVNSSAVNATAQCYTSGVVQTECQAAIVANGLDHLIAAEVTGTDVIDNSIIAKLVSKAATADWDTYSNLTDSLEASIDDSLSDVSIVTALLDHDVTAHVTAGTVGKLLNDSISAAERNAIADALLNRNMASVAITNTRCPANALRFLRNKRGIVGSTLTVMDETDVTPAWTAALTLSVAAVPVIDIDPAGP